MSVKMIETHGVLCVDTKDGHPPFYLVLDFTDGGLDEDDAEFARVKIKYRGPDEKRARAFAKILDDDKKDAAVSGGGS